MKEKWKDVVGYEGLYRVSTFGRVRSKTRYVKHWRGGRMLRKGVMLKPGRAAGYKLVILCKEGKIKYKTVHSLVLEAFVGPCPKGMIARHFPDRIRTNCKLSNLSWATTEVNRKDMEFHGTNNNQICGEDRADSKLSNEKAIDIYNEVTTNKEKGVAKRLADENKVSQATVSLIKHGKTWKKVIKQNEH